VTWWPDAPGPSGDRVAVVTVSYNTRELTALLLWSLRQILQWPCLDVVVVDNGSDDGSAELLADAEKGGVCVLLANHRNRHHGPALTQGISWLAARSGSLPNWIWVLDSDVVVSRPDAVSAAVAAADGHSAALVGESHWDRWHKVDRFESYSLLFRPDQVWRPGVQPFVEGGDPSFDLIGSLTQLGIRTTEFPFTADNYLIHRGRSSLAAVVDSEDSSHPHYNWAVEHHHPHFGGIAGAAERHELLLRSFRDEVGPLSGPSLVSACSRSSSDS
jgi:glycosyltransferase involved in cell wall biosynthesis